MKRAVFLSTALAASLAFVAPTQAQGNFTESLSQTFERVCLKNRPNFDQAVPLLEAEGYVQSGPADEGTLAIRKFETRVGDALWTVQLGDRAGKLVGDQPANRVRACTVIGPDPGHIGEAELAAWLGIPKAPAGNATGSLFVEKDGQRRLMAAGSDELAAAKAEAGGFYSLNVVKTGAGKMVMLVFVSPAQ